MPITKGLDKLVKYNNRSIKDLTTTPTAAGGGDTGALVHIKTLTASSSATLSFVDGADSVVLDDTYPIYKFEFINCHPSESSGGLTVAFRDGGSNFDATKTTTIFYTGHDEGDSATALSYVAGQDQAQATGAMRLTVGDDANDDNDGSLSGTMMLFNPSSTTYVKHFMSQVNFMGESSGNPSTNTAYMAGYCNVTAAIDAVQIGTDSGNIDAGTIKLYGLKDS